MRDNTNSILINAADDVATAIVELHPGDVGNFLVQGRIVEVAIREEIPMYHKFAIRNISKSDRVLKYGEVIGQAICEIPAGAHVHTHNIESPGRRR